LLCIAGQHQLGGRVSGLWPALGEEEAHRRLGDLDHRPAHDPGERQRGRLTEHRRARLERPHVVDDRRREEVIATFERKSARHADAEHAVDRGGAALRDLTDGERAARHAQRRLRSQRHEPVEPVEPVEPAEPLEPLEPLEPGGVRHLRNAQPPARQVLQQLESFGGPGGRRVVEARRFELGSAAHRPLRRWC
jgi:hypothetical protein